MGVVNPEEGCDKSKWGSCGVLNPMGAASVLVDFNWYIGLLAGVVIREVDVEAIIVVGVVILVVTLDMGVVIPKVGVVISVVGVGGG